MRPLLITFDCYGTLIDWSGGLSLALSRLNLPETSRGRPFERYVEIEMEIEAGPYVSYREVTARALERTLAEAGHRLPPERRTVVADSIPEWAPFEEAADVLRELAREVPLAILSNIDDDLLESSVRRLGAPFAHRITAEQVRSYKPAPGHFLAVQERTGLPADRILHVGASLEHDMAPCRDLGIPAVWINRQARPVPDWFPPDRSLPDLRPLPRLAFPPAG